MRTWPIHPVIYEINTWVWLGELSRKARRPVNLATVPEKEWEAIASHGFDAVWLMGVWERSPAGIEISMQNKGLLEDFRRRTMSVRLIACAATSWTNISGEPGGLPRREKSLPSAACGLFSILCPTTWRPTTSG